MSYVTINEAAKIFNVHRQCIYSRIKKYKIKHKYKTKKCIMVNLDELTLSYKNKYLNIYKRCPNNTIIKKNPNIFTINEIADFFNVKKHQIYNAIYHNKIPFIKKGKHYLIKCNNLSSLTNLLKIRKYRKADDKMADKENSFKKLKTAS